jgi:hypothetical protein
MAAAAIMTAAMTAEMRTTVTAATALVMIDLVALAIAQFVTRHIVATTITLVFIIAIAFVSV